jgi:hypothetical protein
MERIDRLPAIPLICMDPYLSIWMPADTMTATDTAHWCGPAKPIRGAIRVDGRNVGTVAQKDARTGLFSRYQYHEMHLDGRTYELYSVGLGKEGTAGCLYCADSQLAQIDKGTTVRNNLHAFEIFAVDQQAAFVSILMCCYRFVRGCYQPGEKAVTSVATNVSVTGNKTLKAKYNPSFKSTHYTL